MSRLDTLERNWLINGAFDLFQMVYSNAVNITGTLSYLNADMFRIAYTGIVTGVPTAVRSTNVPSNGKSLNSLNLRCQRNASAVTLSVQQRIASFDAIELSNQVVSLSTQYKFPVATQIQIILSVPTVIDNYTSEAVIYNQTVAVTADNNWNEFKHEAITLPNVAAGLAVRFNIILPSGTDGSVIDHLVTQIKLNKGYKSVGFSRAGGRFLDEVVLAQQFLEKSYDLSIDPATPSSNGLPDGQDLNLTSAASTNLYNATRPFATRKRSVPTLTFYAATSGVANNVSNSGGTNVALSGQIFTSQINRGYPVASVSQGAGASFYFHWLADARI